MNLDAWSTEEIHVRPFVESDVSLDYLATLNDTKYMRFSRQSAFTHTRASALAYLREVTEQGGVMLAGTSVSEECLVATATVRPLREVGVLEMGLMTMRGFHARGYGLSMWRACLERLRVLDGVACIQAGTHRQNVGMRRILDLSGFRRQDNECSSSSYGGGEPIRYFLDVSEGKHNAAIHPV